MVLTQVLSRGCSEAAGQGLQSSQGRLEENLLTTWLLTSLRISASKLTNVVAGSSSPHGFLHNLPECSHDMAASCQEAVFFFPPQEGLIGPYL